MSEYGQVTSNEEEPTIKVIPLSFINISCILCWQTRTAPKLQVAEEDRHVSSQQHKDSPCATALILWLSSELWPWRWHREKFLKLLACLGTATTDTTGTAWAPGKRRSMFTGRRAGWSRALRGSDTLQGEVNQAELLERLQHPYPCWYIQRLE